MFLPLPVFWALFDQQVLSSMFQCTYIVLIDQGIIIAGFTLDITSKSYEWKNWKIFYST